jgi:hypothetical protein
MPFSPVDPIRISMYPYSMTTQQLITEALALPLAQRIELAQTLWESIDCGLPEVAPEAAILDAVRRDAELTSGTIVGRTHAEVMAAARQSLK